MVLIVTVPSGEIVFVVVNPACGISLNTVSLFPVVLFVPVPCVSPLVVVFRLFVVVLLESIVSFNFSSFVVFSVVLISKVLSFILFWVVFVVSCLPSIDSRFVSEFSELICSVLSCLTTFSPPLFFKILSPDNVHHFYMTN